MSTAIQRHLRQQRPFRSLEEEVFVGLQVAADRLMAPWARHLRETADLSPAQYNVLRILRGAGPTGLGAGEVAERLITRSPDVTRLVDRLEARRLVRRRRDPEDRRAVRIQLTDRGRAQVTDLDADARAMLAAGLQPFGRPELEALRDTLGRILDAVEPLD